MNFGRLADQINSFFFSSHVDPGDFIRFELIRRHFADKIRVDPDLLLGIRLREFHELGHYCNSLE